MKIAALEMQPVGDHQLDFSSLHLRDHRPTIRLIQSHRLFAQDVDSGLRCRLRLSTMHVIGQSYINRVNLATRQAVSVLFVGIVVSRAIFAGKALEFLRISRDERSKSRVGRRMGKSRQNGNLRNISQSDYRVPNRSIFSAHSFPFSA